MNEVKCFADVISFSSLYKANKLCLRGKRYKREAIEYQNNLGSNLIALFYLLKYHKYKIKKYHKFMIYDPKEREIQAISYEDRIVQRAICDNYLIPLLDRYLYFYNVACRKNKGTSLAVSYVKNGLRRFYKRYGNSFYVIKLDIHKYFESIDHTILKKKLVKIVKDLDMLNLLFSIIDSFNFESNKGLPMGNQTSQCFALLYLNDIDHYIKEKLPVKYYVRYMDDMILFVENRNKAAFIFKEINSFVIEENLVLNPKSQIIKISKGFEFLGRIFKISKSSKVIVKIKNASKRRILKHCYNVLEDENIDLNNTYQSYNGIFKFVSNNHLKMRVKYILKS